MSRGFVAKASISIKACTDAVWDAFTKPEILRQYMFGTKVLSDWKEGSPILWQGEWQGKRYEDRGVILKIEPKHLIRYTHFSPLSGELDAPANYHTVTVTIHEDGANTVVSLSQDNNATEESREHSEKNWKVMLEGLKRLLER